MATSGEALLADVAEMLERMRRDVIETSEVFMLCYCTFVFVASLRFDGEWLRSRRDQDVEDLGMCDTIGLL